MIRIMYEDRASFADKFGQDLLNDYLSIRQRISDTDWKDMDKVASTKTKEEIQDYINNFKSKTQTKKAQRNEGSKFLWEECGFKCYEVTTYDAMKQIGYGTTWCLAGNYEGHEDEGQYWFDYYKNEHDLTKYYVLIGHGDKYCILKDYDKPLSNDFDYNDEVYNADQTDRDSEALDEILAFDDENFSLNKRLFWNAREAAKTKFGGDKIYMFRKMTLDLDMERKMDYEYLINLSVEEFNKLFNETKNKVIQEGFEFIDEIDGYKLSKGTSNVALQVINDGQVEVGATPNSPVFVATKNDEDIEIFTWNKNFQEWYILSNTVWARTICQYPKKLRERIIKEYRKCGIGAKYSALDAYFTFSREQIFTKENFENEVIDYDGQRLLFSNCITSLMYKPSDLLEFLQTGQNETEIAPIYEYLEDTMKELGDELPNYIKQNRNWVESILLQKFNRRELCKTLEDAIMDCDFAWRYFIDFINDLSQTQYKDTVLKFININEIQSWFKNVDVITF